MHSSFGTVWILFCPVIYISFLHMEVWYKDLLTFSCLKCLMDESVNFLLISVFKCHYCGLDHDIICNVFIDGGILIETKRIGTNGGHIHTLEVDLSTDPDQDQGPGPAQRGWFI